MQGAIKLFPEYSSLFDTFNKHEIPFCLLRDDVRSGDLLTDLDLLIAEDRFNEAIQVLQELGYRIKNTERLNPYKMVLVKYTEEGKFVDLDLHRRLVYQGVIYLDHQRVLEHRRKIENYYLPLETDFLMILIFHNILGKGEIQDKHYPLIKTLIKQVDDSYARAALKDFGTEEAFFSIIKHIDQLKMDSARLLEIRHNLLKSLYRKNPLTYWRVGWLKLKKLLFRFSLKRRGFLISCLGVDGAGKSSTAAALQEIFNGHPGFRASVHYMGPWGHYHLKMFNYISYGAEDLFTTREFIKKLFHRDHPEKLGVFRILRLSYKVALEKDLTEEEKKFHEIARENSIFYLFLRYIRSTLDSMLFFLLITLEMYFRYLKIYRKLRTRHIVITDRYIYDLMVGSMHEVTQAHKRIRSFLCAIFFKPHKVFLLRNTPEQILARKNQLTADNLQAIQAVYDELALKYHFINILTDQEPRLLAHQIIETHFDEIMEAIRI